MKKFTVKTVLKTIMCGCMVLRTGVNANVTNQILASNESVDDADIEAAETAVLTNPLLPLDEFIPDVEARVFTNAQGEQRLYLYGSHDDYGAGTWCSYQYHVWSAPLDNLGDWTDHGVSFASKTGEGYIWDGEDADGIAWSDARLYAPDVIQIGDTYYLITCSADSSSLGVATSKNPEGPFSPAQKIVYDNGQDTSSIDPSIYVEGEGEDLKVYLYWGQRAAFNGSGLHGAQLVQDDEGIYRIVKTDTEKIIMGGWDDYESGFYEGASVRKINGKYYMLYPSDKGKGVHMMSYAIADSPLGDYKYTGDILDNDGGDLSGGNNHGSLCEINGQWYIFYHRGFGNSNYQRKVCAEKIYFDENGKIGDENGNQVQMTNHGLGGPLSPYEKIEAAYATHVRLDGFKSGCYLIEKSKDLHPLINITDGNCVEYRDFDFGQNQKKLIMSAEILSLGGGSMDIILDDPQNAPIGTMIIPANVSKEYTTLYANVSEITGVHTVYLRFHSEQNGNICELASFTFNETDNVLHEDFDAGFENWKNTDHASIENSILTIANNQNMESVLGEEWTEGSVDVRAAILNEQAGIVFHKQNETTYYLLEVKENGMILRKSVNGIEKTIGQMDEKTALNEFHTYHIEYANHMISIYKDGSWKGTFNDGSIANGKVGFYQPDGSSAQYDRIYVSDKFLRKDWIEINGQVFEKFTPEQTTYTISLEEGTAVPTLRAFSTDKNVTTKVTQAENLPGSATVVIGDQTYTIQFQTKAALSLKSNDFVNEAVGDFWEVVNSNPDNVKYESGVGLKIQTEKGDIGNTQSPAKNIYLQNGEGDWTIETVLSANPAFGQISGNWPSAGLVVYGEDGQFVKLIYLPGGVEFNTSTNAKEQLPIALNDPNQQLYLKLEKSGNQYTAYYSTTGKDDYKGFSSTRTMNISGVRAGIMTTGFMYDAQTEVTFKEFIVNGNEEPAEQFPEFVPVNSLALTFENVTILNGDTISISVDILPENVTYKDIVWDVKSDNIRIIQGKDSDIVTIQGVKAGTTTLTATLKDDPNMKAECSVKVRNPMLESIEDIEPLVNIANGTDLNEMPFPKEVILNTEIGQVRANVTWDLENTQYDIHNKEEQTFQVNGKITLPDTIEMPEDTDILNVSIQITVLAGSPDVDKSALQNTIEAAHEITEEELNMMHEDAVKEFKSAIKEAETVLTSDTATQEEVDAATEELEAAIKALTYKDADYTAVDAAIVKANKLNKEDYKNFSDVEDAIKAVVRGKNITEQDAVDAMAKAIEDAIDGLIEYEKEPWTPIEPSKVNKSNLEKAVEEAKDIDLDEYTDITGTVLEKAIKDAEKVLADDKASQADVNYALEVLNKAVEGLEKAETPVEPVDPTEPEKPETPSTSDTMNIMVLASIMMISGLAFILLSKKKKVNE